MVVAKCLPPLLRQGLTVVFIGTRPGEESLRTGHYYAGGGNSFYQDLKDTLRTGFTDVRLSPDQDAKLLNYGIGLHDVYSGPDSLKNRTATGSCLQS